MREYEYEPMMRPKCSHCKMSQMTMPEYMMPQYGMKDDLEEMYPQIYYTIHSNVRHHCDMMEMTHGGMHHYLKEEIDEMCDRIYEDCEKELEEYMEKKEEDADYDYEHEHNHDHDHEHNHDHRQYGHYRNRFGTDIVRILLLNELLDRRRRRRRRRPYGHFY